MSSALDQFERKLVAASRTLHEAAQAATTAPAGTAETRQPLTDRRPTRKRFHHRRLLVSLAALLIAAGGVAAASSLLWPAQRLADGTVNCFAGSYGRSMRDRTFAAGSGQPNGQPPISLCRTAYRSNRYRLNNSTTGPLVAGLPLIACKDNATTVDVYVASGPPDQCRRLGEKPLPATYAAAAARLPELQQSLRALETQHDCVPPTTLAGEARAVLVGQGFSGWHVITPH